MTLPTTFKHTLPLLLAGDRVRGSAPSGKGNSWKNGQRLRRQDKIMLPLTWLSVTWPVPSARPPQENMTTVFPAERRGSKLRHAWVRSLTMRATPFWSLCLPLVYRGMRGDQWGYTIRRTITSHLWVSLPSQFPTWMGFRLLRKSPEPFWTNKQRPSEVCSINKHRAG
jgi:hypothetical protein